MNSIAAIGSGRTPEEFTRTTTQKTALCSRFAQFVATMKFQ